MVMSGTFYVLMFLLPIGQRVGILICLMYFHDPGQRASHWPILVQTTVYFLLHVVPGCESFDPGCNPAVACMEI